MRSYLLLQFSVLLSLLIALCLELLPLPPGLGAWQPPWVLLTLLYWVISQRGSVGMTGAFVMGLVMDVAASTPLGVHALAYVPLTALTLLAQRILITQTVIQQALWMAGATTLLQLVILLMGHGVQDDTPLAQYFLPSLATLIAWPLLNLVAWYGQIGAQRFRARWKKTPQ